MMQVRLKILKGSQSGKLLPVTGPKFLIGRGDDCQLRPHSDMISRQHCLLIVQDDQVLVQELGSKNGTFVNKERIEGERVLNHGDRLRIGPLEFEVCMAGQPETRIEAPPTEQIADDDQSKEDAASSEFTIDEDVGDWLDEADDQENSRRLAEPDTRQFKLDETHRVSLDQSGNDTSTGAPKDGKGKKKKEPGKLPPPPSQKGKDSKEAAAIMLRKLFNR